jgi:SAM-dependent methyltransferase
MKVLAEKDHRISCHTTSAEQLPYPTASFDMAVSQFGIEYAPPRAFGEAVRVLRPGGTFHFLCHIEGGVIHTEVRGHRRGADALLASGFFDAAKILTAELFGQPGTNGREAYGRAEPLALQSGTPLAQHAIGGFRQMAARFRAYDQKDIFGWLGGMEEEARAYAGRLASMEEAALTEEAAKAAVRALENAGAACEPLAVFRLDPAEAPAAWVIKGTCKRG